jgi:ATP-binding cassette subfamily B (MDR/TAP) protein 1
VAEQGYRYDLEGVTAPQPDADSGEFRKMMEVQRATGGFLPEEDVDANTKDLEEVFENDEEEDEARDKIPTYLKHQSIAIRPLTFGNWMFEVVADLTGAKPSTIAVPPSLPTRESTYRVSRFVPADKFATFTERPRRPSSVLIPSSPTSQLASRRYSLPFTPTSTTFTMDNRSTTMMVDEKYEEEEEDQEFEGEKNAVKMMGVAARNGRSGGVRTRWAGDVRLAGVKVDGKENSEKDTQAEESTSTEDMQRPPFWALMRIVYPTIPGKPLLFFGLLICILSGAMTPIFSFLLSRLLFEVSTGGTNVSVINHFGGLVLGIAAIDGLFLGSKYYIMESVAMSWITSLRSHSLTHLLAQDKKWFDRPSHTPARLVQILVKDAEDARNLVSVVWGQCLVVGAMLGVGIVWAIVRGWQLTLAGCAIAPVFALTMAVQSGLVAGCEVRNKRAREEVARGYYDVCLSSLS